VDGLTLPMMITPIAAKDTGLELIRECATS
jgi:hypothetical protein